MSYNSFPPWNYKTQANLDAKTLCVDSDGNFDYTEEGMLRYDIVRLVLTISYYKDFYKFHS